MLVMDHAISLLDTPKSATLQKQADTLRAALKDFERTFAATHDGRKPGKSEIKADVAIAKKYTEYNKIRDVLAGKLGLGALNTPQPRARHTRTDSAISLTPRHSRHKSTPSKSRAHPGEFDPYDAPSSTSPKTLPIAIGPTPRRDGTVLGIFDMLPPTGSGQSSQATPSGRKRKRDAVLDGEERVVLAQTPSQRRSQRTDTHLVATPGSRTTPGNRKHSKTPVSEGKRFMLDHFFATPSAVRFSSLVQDDANPTPPAQSRTPLRDALLGLSPARGDLAADTATDATPPYLKRSFSFKERLLSASGSGSRPPSSSSQKGIMSPSKTRTGPRTLRHVQFAPKPLSQMITELESQKNETRQAENNNGDDEDEDDDLEALREMEATEINVLVDDSQLGGTVPSNDADAHQEPTRVWKKKGQKRTTRRVIMRPVKWKPSTSKATAVDAADDSEDELALDHAPAEELEGEEEDVSRVEETQLIDAHVNAGNEFDADSDTDYLIAEAEAEQGGASRGAAHAPLDDDFEDDDESSPELAGLERARKTASSKFKSKLGPSKGAPDKAKAKKDKSKDADEDGSKTRMINPNAHSHMNFKSLKIKNKNSKAKGRGRFGRGRR
ncbi:DNA replication regulator SLD2 [Exophiala viscosa]|uniref:DNA replication regulator SLD2 n=1 Tax=Exophiala viscosa TaxID=2486360 RepID=A0AAN6I9M0_9EURO|nr:DNA replication regulator SLD2 [Exophiala viscosa]KAI1620790.1 DNA replication regulator SLD2 [Exophiala viscosa]